MPWKWLSVLFLLCAMQGWLLSITSISMLLTFGVIVGIVCQAIALNPSLAKDYTDYTYFRQYPIAAPGEIKTAQIKTVVLVWAILLGWNLAEVTDNLWHEAISWQVAIALTISSFMATAIIWLWITMAAVVAHKLAELKLSSVNSRFWVLVASSWLGMITGNLFS